jgi:hypothetical protein
MLFLTSLQLGMLVASMCPDIISALKKEHHKILNLRTAYKDMLKHLDAWEKDQLKHQESKFILEKALESKNMDEFLEALKKRFDLVDISIKRIESILPYETKKDYKNGVLQVNLPKDGYSIVLNVEFSNPIDLYNENLISNLEYIAGIFSFSYMERVSHETLLWANHEVA